MRKLVALNEREAIATWIEELELPERLTDAGIDWALRHVAEMIRCGEHHKTGAKK